MVAHAELLRTDAYADLLERRVAALRQLALEMSTAREAFIHLDLERIQQHTLNQENLCTEIHFLDAEIAAQCGTAPAEGKELAAGKLSNNDRLEKLKLEDKEATAMVARHNSVQGALLRRSRRSVNALMNFLAQYSGAYASLRGGLQSGTSQFGRTTTNESLQKQALSSPSKGVA